MNIRYYLPPAVLELELQQVTDAHLTLLVDKVLAVHESAVLVLRHINRLANGNDDLLALNVPKDLLERRDPIS